MIKKENQRIALTKRLLQEGLLRLIEKKELSKISVTELCRESGINRATFYKYYGCPDDVLAAIKEQFFQELLESQQPGSIKNQMTYLEAFSSTCSYFYEHKELAKHIIKNLNFDISDILEQLSEQNGTFEYLKKNFDTEGAALAATYIGYSGYSIIRKWLAEDIDKTPEEITAIVHKLMNNDLLGQ